MSRCVLAIAWPIQSPRAIVIRDGVAVFASGGIPIWFDHESVNQTIGAPSDIAA